MRLVEIFKKVQRQAAIGVMALALVVGFSPSARATLVDLDGTGGATGAVDIGAFDWNFTSFLAQGGTTAIGNFITSGGACSGTSCQFTVLSQGSLQGVSDTGGNAIAIGGLNSSYQITYVAKFTEQVTSANLATGQASFSTVTSAPVILEIYFSPINSNQINGSGFNDGTLILTGSVISSATGNFTVTNPTATTLDQFGANNYGTQNTVTGIGTNAIISVGGLTTDPAFFIQALQSFGLQFSNLSMSLPFNSTNPMVCFNQTAAAVGVGGTATLGTGLDCEDAVQVNGQPYSGQGAIVLDGGYLPVVGGTNGLFASQGGGPDFIAQTDPNSPLIGAVPEPASFLLFGFGLLGMGGYLRTRNRKSK